MFFLPKNIIVSFDNIATLLSLLMLIATVSAFIFQILKDKFTNKNSSKELPDGLCVTTIKFLTCDYYKNEHNKYLFIFNAETKESLEDMIPDGQGITDVLFYINTLFGVSFVFHQTFEEFFSRLELKQINEQLPNLCTVFSLDNLDLNEHKSLPTDLNQCKDLTKRNYRLFEILQLTIEDFTDEEKRLFPKINFDDIREEKFKKEDKTEEQ